MNQLFAALLSAAMKQTRPKIMAGHVVAESIPEPQKKRSWYFKLAAALFLISGFAVSAFGAYLLFVDTGLYIEIPQKYPITVVSSLVAIVAWPILNKYGLIDKFFQYLNLKHWLQVLFFISPIIAWWYSGRIEHTNYDLSIALKVYASVGAIVWLFGAVLFGLLLVGITWGLAHFFF